MEQIVKLQAKEQQLATKSEMALMDHLQELRQRLIKAIGALGAGSIVSYFYIEQILSWLIAPAGKLYYLNPAEAFFTYCKIALVGGLVLAMPVIMYQFWQFLLPALTDRELSAGLVLVPSSILLFYGGVTFSHFFVVPAAIKFFIGFSNDYLLPMFSLGQYVSFVLSLLYPFGLVFELPLVILVLTHFGLISSSLLAQYRKYTLVGAFIAGGIISPTPDILGQTMLAMPIIMLYELSYFIAKYGLKK